MRQVTGAAREGGERIQRRVDRLLDQAEEAADRKDWRTAEQLAREAGPVLDINPRRPGIASASATDQVYGRVYRAVIIADLRFR